MKYNNIHWCKYCNKTDQIDENNWKTCLNKYTFWKTNWSQRELQFWSFGIWDSRKCWFWTIYNMIPLEVITDRYRAFTYVLKQAKTVFFSLYNLLGRIHYFFRKSTLYINGFSNSDQFDLICLDYTYQLVESWWWWSGYPP